MVSFSCSLECPPKIKKCHKSSKRNHFFSWCNKVFNIKKKHKYLKCDEKRHLQELYNTPCSSICFDRQPCKTRDFGTCPSNRQMNYPCYCNNGRQTSMSTVVIRNKTRKELCKCYNCKAKSWVYEHSDSSSNEEPCKYVSKCSRKESRSNTEENVEYLSLRMECLKSDCESGRRCPKLYYQPLCHCNRNPSPCQQRIPRFCRYPRSDCRGKREYIIHWPYIRRKCCKNCKCKEEKKTIDKSIGCPNTSEEEPRKACDKIIRNAFVDTFMQTSKALNDGFYSSPASGKKYNLEAKTFVGRPVLKENLLPKPLSVSEAFPRNSNSLNLSGIETEHTLLLTAVCDALMSSKASDETYKQSINLKNSKFTKSKSFHTLQELQDKNFKPDLCNLINTPKSSKSSRIPIRKSNKLRNGSEATLYSVDYSSIEENEKPKCTALTDPLFFKSPQELSGARKHSRMSLTGLLSALTNVISTKSNNKKLEKKSKTDLSFQKDKTYHVLFTTNQEYDSLTNTPPPQQSEGIVFQEILDTTQQTQTATERQSEKEIQCSSSAENKNQSNSIHFKDSKPTKTCKINQKTVSQSTSADDEEEVLNFTDLCNFLKHEDNGNLFDDLSHIESVSIASQTSETNLNVKEEDSEKEFKACRFSFQPSTSKDARQTMFVEESQRCNFEKELCNTNFENKATLYAKKSLLPIPKALNRQQSIERDFRPGSSLGVKDYGKEKSLFMHSSTSSFCIPEKVFVNSSTSPINIRKPSYVKNVREVEKGLIIEKESPFSMFCSPVISKNVPGPLKENSKVLLPRVERKVVVGKVNKNRIRDKRWQY